MAGCQGRSINCVDQELLEWIVGPHFILDGSACTRKPLAPEKNRGGWGNGGGRLGGNLVQGQAGGCYGTLAWPLVLWQMHRPVACTCLYAVPARPFDSLAETIGVVGAREIQGTLEPADMAPGCQWRGLPVLCRDSMNPQDGPWPLSACRGPIPPRLQHAPPSPPDGWQCKELY